MSSKRRVTAAREPHGASVKDRMRFAEPRTQLARAALEARRQHLATGERLLDLNEVNAEVAARRGSDRVDE